MYCISLFIGFVLFIYWILRLPDSKKTLGGLQYLKGYIIYKKYDSLEKITSRKQKLCNHLNPRPQNM